MLAHEHREKYGPARIPNHATTFLLTPLRGLRALPFEFTGLLLRNGHSSLSLLGVALRKKWAGANIEHGKSVAHFVRAATSLLEFAWIHLTLTTDASLRSALRSEVKWAGANSNHVNTVLLISFAGCVFSHSNSRGVTC